MPAPPHLRSIVLVSDSLTPTDVWDLSQDKRILQSMEQLVHSTRTSQLMALQQKQLLSTALLRCARRGATLPPCCLLCCEPLPAAPAAASCVA